MLIIRKNILIYFGDKTTSFNPEHTKQNIDAAFKNDPFATIQQTMGIAKSIFLHQVHGNKGAAFLSRHDALQFIPFSHDGDFMITNQPGIGLAAATADCLPIILYDRQNHCVAVVHAGWKGTLAGVTTRALEHMIQQCNTAAENVQAYFGPSACGYCYHVGTEFKELIPEQYKEVLRTDNNALFLDVPLLNRLQLQSVGVQKFDLSSNLCTIENDNFCSYRRDNKNPLRQISVVALNAFPLRVVDS